MGGRLSTTDSPIYYRIYTLFFFLGVHFLVNKVFEYFIFLLDLFLLFLSYMYLWVSVCGYMHVNTDSCEG